MKVVILCGGFGTRLAEETDRIPKPMVLIGKMPILWHIMKIYDHFAFTEFFLTLGYKGEIIKKFFLNYHLLSGDLLINTKSGKILKYSSFSEDWDVHLIDTGLNTMTGGRIKRLETFLKGDTFMMTYGDGVANIDLKKLIEFHKSHGKLATVTAVKPRTRFGELEYKNGKVINFTEKPKIHESRISGGYFVLEPEVLNYIEGDETIWERDPIERLVKEGELMAYEHDGFWQCMDNIRELRYLRELWANNKAPWKVWDF
ncbi:MAG: glucose-1-phosphate cytidylyltransferase [Candidatus Helarchaeota archaeon]